MKKDGWVHKRFLFWSFLILNMLCFSPDLVYGQSASSRQIDSLRMELEQQTGADKASVQLELALQIHEREQDEAKKLAQAAMEWARIHENRNLELQANYVLGRIHFVLRELETSDAFYNQALALSDTLNENWHKAEILFRKGVIEHQKGESLEALEYFNEAVQESRLSGNFRPAGSSYSIMGTIFRLNGLYDRAIEYIIKSKLNYEKAGFPEGDAWAAYLLGRIYADLNNSERAMDYFREALEKYQKIFAIDGNEGGIAICYEQIGLLHLESGNLEEARKNIQRVFEIHQRNGSEYGISNAYKDLGKIEYYSGDYDEAENCLNQALEMKKEINDLLSQASIYEYIGLSQIARGETANGFANIKQGLEIAGLNGQKKIQLEIYSKLTDAYLKLNDWEEVIFYQRKQIETQDSLLSGTANIKMEQLQAILEIDQKNRQIADLEKQNEIKTLSLKQQRTSQIMMAIGTFFVFILAGIIFFFYHKLHRKNNELNKINTAKDRFFSIIAHDLKGPIGSSLALSRILAEEYETDKESSKHYSKLLVQSLNSSYSLLTNLLEWARSQFQKTEFNPQPLVLPEAVDEIKTQMLSQFQEKNVNIKVKMDDDQQVYADAGMLKTILRNLMSNAVKYSSPNGEIYITSKSKENFTELSIRDFGIGIEPEVIPHLFEFNEHVSKPGTHGEQGTGLGLILVKEFVETHGGEIWVESQTGKGSVFTFTLPVV